MLGRGGPSVQRVKTPFLPPKKRAEFKSPELYSQHCNGSDGSSREPSAEKPTDPIEEAPPVVPTKARLGSHVTVAVSAPPLSKSSDFSVSITQRNSNDQGDALGLCSYIEKKRMLANNSLADIEEGVKVTRKKTRLGWGEGLAKYEKQLKDQNAQNLVGDGDNGDTGSIIMTNNKAIVCTATASSHGPSPSPGERINLLV